MSDNLMEKHAKFKSIVHTCNPGGRGDPAPIAVPVIVLPEVKRRRGLTPRSPRKEPCPRLHLPKLRPCCRILIVGVFLLREGAHVRFLHHFLLIRNGGTCRYIPDHGVQKAAFDGSTTSENDRELLQHRSRQLYENPFVMGSKLVGFAVVGCASRTKTNIQTTMGFGCQAAGFN